MVRAPYPARIAAGLLVTAVEETRKIPALLITLPMTAVSQTLQAGMRAQQNIAELAIKGDLVLEQFFDRPDEQPSWARFDEDDALPPAAEDAAEDTVRETAPDENPAATLADDADDPTAELPAAEDDDVADIPDENPVARLAGDGESGSRGAGRFALYSSAPDAVTATAPKPTTGTDDGPVPEIVEYLEYDGLTLAQLRAKIRTVGLDELEELAAYERDHRARAPFVTMLDNRITAQKNKK
ncbi:lipid droplet-associated protein [Gordonia soli]|uniref:Lipid droplet-associated protein n=1 Tax=Gordonia soli NBRC 108243 TaxID=1223545 RepID=M0QQ31_9ACTN|nr:lipid droplet-associated protein [Gordonia soli]GAC70494.1 hypothetical protein GS4_35_00700 [Gordonia soli NBRC 108243]